MNSSNDSKSDQTVIHAPTDRSAEKTIIRPPVLKNQDQETVAVGNTLLQNSNEPTENLTIGSILQNRFVLQEVLGSGGMGTVYRATDIRRQEAQDQQTDVAIKVLNSEFRNDPELLIALQRETKKTQLLAHPNIVTVYDFDRDGNNVFMVMELLEGNTLAKYIKEQGVTQKSLKSVWHIIQGLALPLAYAHKKNIIHSDFKPGNVFMSMDSQPKILDFGIACAAVMSDSQKEDTIFNARDLGALTPAYASLEMLQGKDPHPADDVYALACVCYELLSGKHPFGRLSAEKALELKLDVPVITSLTRRQRMAINHALAIKRKQRTASIEEFLDEIEPKSIWPKVLGATTIIAILAAAGSYYYSFYGVEQVHEEIIDLSEGQKLAIKDFLELADIHFEVGYLTSPPGMNALWAFRKVLEIDPYNMDAQNGLKKIAAYVYQQAKELYEAGDYKASLEKIEEGLEAVPKHEELLELKDHVLKRG